MNKTPITILQEMMVKRGEVPSYECINQTGPHHLATFEYKCVAGGVTVTATARSKKEAKQEAARRVLAALNASAGAHAPSSPPPQPAVAKEKALPSSSQSGGPDEGDAGGAGAGGEGGQWRSYVALLKELCEEYRLGAVQYDLVGDTGPPHNRRFTMSATLGRKSCTATASTKKQARQLAAEQLYVYLREHLSSVTKDFVEKSEPKVRVKTEKAEKVEDEVVQGSPRKRKSETEEDQQTKRNCDLDTLFQSIDRLSEDALSRALDKVMARYVDMKEEQQWRPDLSQRIADYHRGLLDSVSEEQLKAAEAVEGEARGTREHAAEELRALAEALGLSVEVERLAGEGGDLSVVSLGRTAPQLALAGRDPGAAAVAALRYVRRALAQDRAEPLLAGSLRL